MLPIDAIWSGTADMIKNDGTMTNEEAFWKRFVQIFGEKALNDHAVFDDYYENEFRQVKSDCGFNPKAASTVRRLTEKGFRIALATNPIFPKSAIESRIGWVGLKPDDFELYTSYENTSFSKPNKAYYLDIAERLGVSPEECLMVGNNVDEDMVASDVGMKTFLITDCLINKSQSELTAFERGGFDELCEYIEKSAMQ